MNNQESKKPINKNILYICLLVTALIIVIIAIIAVNSKKEKEPETTTALSIVSEKGNQSDTINANIQLREIKFGKSIKAIKNAEAKQTDTLNNPSVATSDDEYTYLSYKFNPEEPSTFFGAQVDPSDATSMLSYVFYKKKLIEVRVQYGKVGSDAYKAIVNSNISAFGDSTYSRSYSNGAEQSWWKTKDVTLEVIYQNNGVVAYYRTNNK